jgi:hypothetical protein
LANLPLNRPQSHAAALSAVSETESLIIVLLSAMRSPSAATGDAPARY